MMWQCCTDSGSVGISFDIKNDLRESRKKLGNDCILLGNYDVFKLPCAEETTVEETVAGIQECIDATVDAVWPGCDMWPDVKEENMHAIAKTIRTYKPGPTPAVGRL
jgi:[methyl-Co(III) methanol-specific corrinoid protein]:coenzyme M methyltransferase